MSEEMQKGIAVLGLSFFATLLFLLAYIGGEVVHCLKDIKEALTKPNKEDEK